MSDELEPSTDVVEAVDRLRLMYDTYEEIRLDDEDLARDRRDRFAAAALTGILANPKTVITTDAGVLVRTALEFGQQMLDLANADPVNE